MSTENKNPEATLSLTRKVLAFFKITEGGKIDSFLLRLIADCDNEIKGRQFNLSKLELEFKRNMEQLKDRLEDAVKAVEDAYCEIPVEKVDTNEKQRSYMATYLAGIERAEDLVEDLNERIEDLKKENSETVAEIKAEIKAYEDRKKKFNA